ncbi:MAG: Na+/H+ antiporter NhaA [Polyangiaceae bacterium]|nr:Na+/H+ antiporter NhaA [Polyangiaceae bacterium]
MSGSSSDGAPGRAPSTRDPELTHPRHAPETWAPARRVADRLLRPLERFLHVEAASGIVLLAAAVVALVWANSAWAASYEALWHTPITLGIGRHVLTQSIHFWVNDGLMTIFFLVVGLEIRREIHSGELSELRRAILPIVAALGGMAAPALIYLALNQAPDVRHGWGTPTATDIAFAVGVLALLGKRVPPALRVLLLALAIIDDIGAIVLIAVFYSSGVAWTGLAVAAGGIAAVLLMQRLGVRRALAYVLPGAVVWAGMLRAGVHPTIAGVLLGLLTPVRSWFGDAGFVATARGAIEEIQSHARRHDSRIDDYLAPLRRMRQAQREALPPVVRVQAALHPWVAYGIMPLFALANAGVSVRGVATGAPASGIMLGVGLGLALGKPIGILASSFAAVRAGLCALPRGVGWRGIMLVGMVAGIGFTMAIFIAGLAFPDPARLGVAKLAVLLGSLASAVAGLLIGRAALPAALEPGAAITVDEAEQATDQ